MSIDATTFQLPQTIPTVKAYNEEKLTKPVNEEMGQKEFLLLFTTQLQNQNPLDPMENEAFVAQLAQFSQLEATVTMGDKMTELADAMMGERMLQGSTLLGKRVAVPNGPAILKGGAPISGIIALPQGADNVELNVYSNAGQLVRTIPYGRQMPGDITVRWDGMNAQGTTMPDGPYRIIATVKSKGEVTQVPISTPDTVKSVTFSAEANDLVLEVSSGGTVNFSQVKRIDAALEQSLSQ
jgi:flagellar basal-body rod modification protein FlgD